MICCDDPIEVGSLGIGMGMLALDRAATRPGSLCARTKGWLCAEGPEIMPRRSPVAAAASRGIIETPLCVATRPIEGELVCERDETTPSSCTRIERPGFSCATTFASVVMPRICATATPRPARHLLSWYSNVSIVWGRSSGLRAIACMTRSETWIGSSGRSWVGGGGSCVAFLVRISMKLSPEYGASPVTIS